MLLCIAARRWVYHWRAQPTPKSVSVPFRKEPGANSLANLAGWILLFFSFFGETENSF